MTTPATQDKSALIDRGLLLGLIGVTIFAVTLPMTRLAVADLDPVFLTAGRAAIAGLLAAMLLWRNPGKRPDRRQWRLLGETALGVVVGFPLFSSIAMRTLPASHGAIVTGLIPLATAVAALLFARERPSPGFWLCAVFGSALVVTYAAGDAGGVVAGDFAMLAAVALAALGYARGGALSREMDGIHVICWALVLSLPFSLSISLWSLIRGWALIDPDAGFGSVSGAAWGGFAYVSVFSMWLGFFFWYRGLAIGGVARVGQMQLLQPFMTVLFAALILGEALEARTMAFAVAVVATVAIGRRMQVTRAN